MQQRVFTSIQMSSIVIKMSQYFSDGLFFNIEMKKAELKAVQEILTELKNRIKHPYAGSDEDLKSEINSFKKQLSVRQEEVEASEIKMKQLESQETKLSNKLMEEQGILGQLLKEDELNSERVEQRNEELIKLAAKLNIDGWFVTSLTYITTKNYVSF